MRPRERRDSWQNDLFRARLDQIVDLDHPLAKLGRAIDLRFLEEVRRGLGTVRNLVCGAIVTPMEGAYGNQERHPGRFAGGA
jgi:hypothetical protein